MEKATPKSIAQNHDLGAVEYVFGSAEIAAEDGSNAEDAEEAGAYALPLKPLRLVSSGYGWLPRLKDRGRVERAAAFREFQSDIGARVAEGPFPSEATVVGSYRLP